MKIRFNLFFFCMALVFCQCKSETKANIAKSDISDPESVETQVKNDTRNQSIDYLIKDSSVRGFSKGDPLPSSADIEDGMIKTQKWTARNGETTEIYTINSDGNKEIVLYPAFDPRMESFANVIGEISIVSPKYHDENGVSVGNSLQEFLKTYPNAIAYYDELKDQVTLSNQGYGLQYRFNASAIMEYDQLAIGKIDIGKLNKLAKISAIHIVRSQQENTVAKKNNKREAELIMENYLQTLLGKYYLNSTSENYYKIHLLQGDYYVSECFEGDCNQKGKIVSTVKNKNGMISLNLENIQGNMIPSWTINPKSNGNHELHVHDYNAMDDKWTDRVFTKG